jgi:CubicO group peptidase (beta-lactamase class C family)
MKVGLALVAALAGATAVYGQANPSPAPITANDNRRAMLPHTQALFDTLVREGKMPGITGAFGAGDLPSVYVSAGRIADDAGAAAAGPDSLWRIYSMTKPVTGMAAMLLVEDGRLGLDEPLAKYFPGFAQMRVLTDPDNSLESVPAKAQITIRMLMTHSAGLGYSIVQKGPIAREYERLGLVPAALNPKVEAQLRSRRPATLAAFAERVATVPLVYEPGSRWSYSIGLDVLAAVVEKASGMPFERFVQTRLFDPLKMRSTFWSVPAGEVKRFATNYAFVGDQRAPVDPAATSVFLQPPSFPYGGAGLISTARDYDRFLHMIQDGGTLDGVRVMKPETVALATSNLLPAGVFFTDVNPSTGGGEVKAKMGYGAGGSVALEDMPNGRSKGTYGWGGAAGTIAWVDPARRVRGTVMVQYFPAEKWGLRQSVPAALAQDVAGLRR